MVSCVSNTKSTSLKFVIKKLCNIKRFKMSKKDKLLKGNIFTYRQSKISKITSFMMPVFESQLVLIIKE